MELFETLKKKQRFTEWNSSRENRFFLDNVGMLQKVPMFSHFVKAEEPFDIIRANIIIRAIKNKERMEKAYLGLAKPLRKAETLKEGDLSMEKLEEIRKDLPCFGKEEERIFIPILPRTVNRIYAGDMWKLEEKPYSSLLGKNVYESLVCDPFDTYGTDVYDSGFTNLIPLGKSPTTAAFYSFDSFSVYFVDRKQGRLEVELCLFDKYLKPRYLNHILERLEPVVAAYLNDDKEGMMKALVENQLVSGRLIAKNISDEKALFAKFAQKASK